MKRLSIQKPCRGILSDLPTQFLCTLFILLAFGRIVLFSASYPYSIGNTALGDDLYYIHAQLRYVLAGMLCMCLTACIPPRMVIRFLPAAYIGCLLGLFLTHFCEPINGCRRWLHGGWYPFSIQPSELCKTLLVFLTSFFLTRDRSTAKKNLWFSFLLPALTLAPVLLLLNWQPHRSAMILVVLIVASVITADGKNFWLCLVCWAAGYAGVMKLFSLARNGTGYFAARLQGWSSDPARMSYQTRTSLYAISSGGLFGKGITMSSFKHGWLPEGYTDFIFSILCEELGFIGAAAVLVLFAILLVQQLVIAMNAPSHFDFLVVMGFLFHIAWQVMLNVAVVTNTIPNTGISLPFFSYGGTSIICCLAEMGWIVNVGIRGNRRRRRSGA